jgi:hypothetical protein
MICGLNNEVVDDLARDYPVWISDINTPGDGCDMINAIGEITSRIDKAAEIAKTIKNNFLQLRPLKTRTKNLLFNLAQSIDDYWWLHLHSPPAKQLFNLYCE